MQMCIQVKRRTIPDRIPTTLPSAFEFPASRKTLHELESSSLEVMIGLDNDLKRDLKKILERNDSMKSFKDSIYGKCLERYGLDAEKRPVKPQKQDGNVSLSD